MDLETIEFSLFAAVEDAAASLSGGPITEAALALETAGRNNDLASADTHAGKLEEEIANFISFAGTFKSNREN